VTAYAQGEGFDQAFLDDVIKILLANEILTVKLLAKCNPSKLLHVKNGPQVSAGKCSFIVDMVESLKTEAPPEKLAAPEAFNVEEVLERVLNKPAKKLVEVDMTKEMKAVGLFCHFPLSSWPALTPVRQLATWQQSKLTHCGSSFVNADIKKFLPSFCPERVDLDSCEDFDGDMPAQKENAKGKNWKLDFATWLIAFDQ